MEEKRIGDLENEMKYLLPLLADEEDEEDRTEGMTDAEFAAFLEVLARLFDTYTTKEECVAAIRTIQAELIEQKGKAEQ